MKTAYGYIQEYKRERGVSKIDNTCDLKEWFEEKLQKPMNGGLFVAMGKGGGQRYKILWNVFDSVHNNNTFCIFYSEDVKASRIIKSHGHLSLDEWIKRT